MAINPTSGVPIFGGTVSNSQRTVIAKPNPTPPEPVKINPPVSTRPTDPLNTHGSNNPSKHVPRPILSYGGPDPKIPTGSNSSQSSNRPVDPVLLPPNPAIVAPAIGTATTTGARGGFIPPGVIGPVPVGLTALDLKA